MNSILIVIHAILVQQAEQLKQKNSEMASKKLAKKVYCALVNGSSSMTLIPCLKPLLAQDERTTLAIVETRERRKGG